MRPLKSYVPTFLRRLAARALPLPSRLSSPNVSDVRRHRIRDGVCLEVYWLGATVLPGPCASLKMLGDEVMRFDCLGPRTGHMHLNMKQSRGFPGGGGTRFYYREQIIEDQIERSCFELGHNLRYAQRLNTSHRIRGIRLDPAESAEAVAFMREQMHRLLERHRPLGRIDSAGAPPMRQAAHDAPHLDGRTETV